MSQPISFPTRTPIPSIFTTGTIQNSPVAEDFHAALRETCGYDAVVTYYTETAEQNCLHIFYRTESPHGLHELDTAEHLTDEPRAEEIFELYFRICDEHEAAYHPVPAREKPTFSPPAKPSMWKRLFGKSEPPAASYTPAHVVTLERFEPLALWHYFELHRTAVEKSLSASLDLSVRVYGQWDDDSGFPVLKVFAHTDAQYAELMARPDLSETMEICRRVMMRYDAFGIMETDWFRVEFGSWAQLPDEVRFGMIRG